MSFKQFSIIYWIIFLALIIGIGVQQDSDSAVTVRATALFALGLYLFALLLGYILKKINWH